ncbi:MAG: hypothetical protein EXR79_03670 [Myxococcales bacterium]|nr:hypothetical protein [Myxococcales bacterium]
MITALSQSLVAGGLSGARPLLVLFLLSAWARFGVAAALPADAAWMVHPVALAVLGSLALVEHAAAVDADVRAMVRGPLAVVAVVCGLWTARIVLLLGLDAATVAAPGLPAGFAAGVFALQRPEDAVALAVGAGAAAAVSALKARVLGWLEGLLLPARWLRWLEAGGVVGTLAAVLLLPVLAVGLAVVLSAVTLGVWLGGRIVQQALDARGRVACPVCGFAMRPEAVRCAGCRTDLPPRLASATHAQPAPL